MATLPRLTRLVFALVMMLALGMTPGLGSSGNALAAAIDCAPATPIAASVSTPVSASPAAAGSATFPASGGTLTVFAAASLTDAFTTMGKDLEAAHPGLTINFNFAGSQVLVSQLKEGAKADVFAAANTKQMAAAVANGSIHGPAPVFTQNRLTIVVPKDNHAKIASAADLSRSGLKLVLAAVAVPVGQYAHDSICKMGKDAATYGAGFSDLVAKNIVSEEDNVKSVLAKVQTGEADAGIVYTTDITATAAKDVTQVSIPAAVNMIAKYPIANVKGGNAELGQAFIDYVLGPKGQATLKGSNFEPKP